MKMMILNGILYLRGQRLAFKFKLKIFLVTMLLMSGCLCF